MAAVTAPAAAASRRVRHWPRDVSDRRLQSGVGVYGSVHLARPRLSRPSSRGTAILLGTGEGVFRAATVGSCIGDVEITPAAAIGRRQPA